jgi:hypothetical protein
LAVSAAEEAVFAGGGRRRQQMAAKGTRIRYPEDIYSLINYWARSKVENFLAIT